MRGTSHYGVVAVLFLLVPGLIAITIQPRLRKEGHLLRASRVGELTVPAGFPALAIPPDNSPARVELGRHLFYDKRLSANGEESCATCHQQKKAFTDGRQVAIGSTGQRHFRNTMTLANVVYRQQLTWSDPGVRSLEQQSLIPLTNVHPIELGFAGQTDRLVQRLATDDALGRDFRAAFPTDDRPVTLSNVERAIASFERTLISGDSRFDHYAFRGEVSALNPSELRGMRLFFSKRIGCGACHDGFNFSGHGGDAFHNNGFSDPRSTDRGLADTTHHRRDRGRFRVPTLRNIEVTAPYMHDGSVATLSEVIDTYAAGGRLALAGRKVPRGVEVRPFTLAPGEKDDLIAFLGSLTDEAFLEDRRFSDPKQSIY